jgi:hypothetical protein
MKGTVVTVTYFNFGHAPFFVSPARHGEAQDMSGDLKQKKQTHTKKLQYNQQKTQSN